MKKSIIALALICALGFIPAEPKEIKLDTNSTEAIQKILVHSINVLDNGTVRNNYDSVKLAIQELSSVYTYLENLKKQASDTTKKKP
jgi:hypothetical protein